MNHTHGGDVYRYRNCIDFSANCNPLGTPDSVREAIRACLPRLQEYPQVGAGRLKERLADYEQLDSSQIICGNGAAEVIFSLCHAKMPKKALVPAPTFAEYEQALQSVGCEVSRYYLDKEEDFCLDERILTSLTEDLDMLFLCNPNNPTGILTDRSLLLKILHHCEANNILFVLDECFLDFVASGEDYTMKESLANSQHIFLLKAFTKRYGMAGVRLGYGLSGDSDLLRKMEQMTQPWNVSSLAQEAGIAALKETAFLSRGREIALSEAPYLMDGLSALGFRVYPSQANYIFFEGPEDLFARCVEKGFLIRDCSNYPGLGKGFFRIAIRMHEDNQALLHALSNLERKEL